MDHNARTGKVIFTDATILSVLEKLFELMPNSFYGTPDASNPNQSLGWQDATLAVFANRRWLPS